MRTASPPTLAAPTQPPPEGEGPENYVRCERINSQSALTRVRSTAPLKILSPRSPTESKTVVLSSFGGGLLGGDRVPIRLHVGGGAALTVLTQSGGKVYRTTGDWSEQSITATVEQDGVLVLVPDPLAAFAGSKYRQIQRFDLAADANLVWLDTITAGRLAYGERWAMREFSSRTTIAVDGRPILRETLELSDSPLPIASLLRMGRFDVYAVLAIAGPRVAAMAEHALGLIRCTPVGKDEPLLAAASPMRGGVVLRILGQDSQTVRRLLFDLLSPLVTITGQHPWSRKW